MILSVRLYLFPGYNYSARTTQMPGML